MHLALATMDALPVADHCADLVVAHGIWNLARSSGEFRRAVAEAARVSRPGAGLFVFTFSRHTLPPDAEPVPGEPFVFTQFSGRPQCFLTRDDLFADLGGAGFTPEPAVPFQEYNRRPGMLCGGGPPVIYEAAFRFKLYCRTHVSMNFMTWPPPWVTEFTVSVLPSGDTVLAWVLSGWPFIFTTAL